MRYHIMRYTPSFNLHLWSKIIAFLLLVNSSTGLNTDGILLLEFKASILNDPLGVLQTWNYYEPTPCSWTGVTCDRYHQVIGLSLPNSQLLASVSPDLALIPNIQILDLSNNSINGSIPLSFYNSSELRVLDLSNNLISGELPEIISGLKSMRSLNLSDNAFTGKIPESISSLSNLTVVNLRDNYFSGSLSNGFDSVVSFDVSSNLMNGSLPIDFGGINLRYLNVSYNGFSGEIPVGFTNKFPGNAMIDLSFNNFTGEIPETSLFANQETKSFSGNAELCGAPVKIPCSIPSPISLLQSASSPTSTPAIAAIPETQDSNPSTSSNSGSHRQGHKSRLRAITIVGIVIGDIVGLGILSAIFIYVYQLKRKKKMKSNEQEYKWMKSWGCLLNGPNDDATSSEGTVLSDDEEEAVSETKPEKTGTGSLITVDGEGELELETLLKASAYILGATGSSIMYKTVLEDGTTLAVRRIGESGVEQFRDFQNQVRVIAKLVHPNLVRIRGFYWGTEEKLVIYDFVSNGSLASARYRKVGSSPRPLPWEARLKIAKGVARGLTYIHDKKHVHGNLKPSNILLDQDMEPKIGDFGFEKLLTSEIGSKVGTSIRNFGSKRSTASRESFQDVFIGPTPSPNPSPSPSSMGCINPYYAPESLRSLKPNAKWDVYSFGVVLLELLTGKVVVLDDMAPDPAAMLAREDKIWVRMADAAIRADMEGKEDALLALLKLGYSCISHVPHKRPSMKEALQLLEKIPSY